MSHRNGIYEISARNPCAPSNTFKFTFLKSLKEFKLQNMALVNLSDAIQIFRYCSSFTIVVVDSFTSFMIVADSFTSFMMVADSFTSFMIVSDSFVSFIIVIDSFTSFIVQACS